MKDVRGESLWKLLYAYNLVIKALSGNLMSWKEWESRGLKVNIDKTKMMVVVREPAARTQRGRH